MEPPKEKPEYPLIVAVVLVALCCLTPPLILGVGVTGLGLFTSPVVVLFGIAIVLAVVWFAYQKYKK